jgi:hypothetical protein
VGGGGSGGDANPQRRCEAVRQSVTRECHNASTTTSAVPKEAHGEVFKGGGVPEKVRLTWYMALDSRASHVNGCYTFPDKRREFQGYGRYGLMKMVYGNRRIRCAHSDAQRTMDKGLWGKRGEQKYVNGNVTDRMAAIAWSDLRLGVWCGIWKSVLWQAASLTLDAHEVISTALVTA